MGHGYEQIKVSEIRKILSEEPYNIIDEEILGQGKTKLVELLLSLQEYKRQEQLDDEQLEEDFENMKEEENSVVVNVDQIDDKEKFEMVPSLYSEKWSDYVISLFYQHELVDNKYPSCDGCRRLVNELIGPIIESGIGHVEPARQENFRTATVIFQIRVRIDNEDHPLKGKIFTLEDVADANKDNTCKPYSDHLAATAATRAEGRTLRKLLGLRTVTAEEVAREDIDDPNRIIESSQIVCIRTICNRLDVNVNEFINRGKNKYKNIEEVSYMTAQKMIEELNKMQQKTFAKEK